MAAECRASSGQRCHFSCTACQSVLARCAGHVVHSRARHGRRKCSAARGQSLSATVFARSRGQHDQAHVEAQTGRRPHAHCAAPVADPERAEERRRPNYPPRHPWEEANDHRPRRQRVRRLQHARPPLHRWLHHGQQSSALLQPSNRSVVPTRWAACIRSPTQPANARQHQTTPFPSPTTSTRAACSRAAIQTSPSLRLASGTICTACSSTAPPSSPPHSPNPGSRASPGR